MLTIEIQSAPAHPIITEVLLVSGVHIGGTVFCDFWVYDFIVCAGPNHQIIPIGSRTPCDECICLVTGVNGQGVGRLLLWTVYNGP